MRRLPERAPWARRLTAIAWLAALGAVAFLTRGFTTLPATYTMTGESMLPSVGRGDWFLTRPPTGPTPRGRLVIVEQRIDDTLYHVLRRAVGLPGDTLRMRDGALRVNGVAAPWPARVIVPRAERPLDGPVTGTIYNWGPVVVGPESLFVLSDTRDMVGWPDSRFFGAVPEERVVGWYVVRIFRGSGERYRERSGERGAVRCGAIPTDASGATRTVRYRSPLPAPLLTRRLSRHRNVPLPAPRSPNIGLRSPAPLS